jgi:hypothetical protein
LTGRTIPLRVRASERLVETSAEKYVVARRHDRDGKLNHQSPTQTERIMRQQIAAAMNPQNGSALDHGKFRKEVWRELPRLLNAVPVRIGNAEELMSGIPTNRVRSRRDLSEVIAVAQAHAIVHQRQRVTVNGAIEATSDDVQAARALCAQLTGSLPGRLQNMRIRLQAAVGAGEFTAEEALVESSVCETRRNALQRPHTVEVTGPDPDAANWRRRR